MKKKIRVLCLILSVLTLLPLCAGCTDEKENADTSSAIDTVPAPTEAPTAAPTEAPTEAETEAPGAKTASVDGKKAIFIGNSFIYYGGVVTKGSPRGVDNAWVYQIAKANNEKLTVYDCTYGGHRLEDFTPKGCKTSGCDVGIGGDLLKGLDLSTFDYVFMSEAGENNSSIIADVKAIMERFTNPNTIFFYMCHTYSYTKTHTNITSNLSTLNKMGVYVIDWGHLCYDVYQHITKVPGGTITYSKNTFVNSTKDDGHHPNPLAGYICSQMVYCALTGKSAVGQDYSMKEKINYGGGSATYANYNTKYYTSGTSNFKDVFASEADMNGLQQLMDKYLEKWGLGVNGELPHPIPVCDHVFDAGKVEKEPTEYQAGLRVYTCTKCGTRREEIIEKTGSRVNVAAGATALIYSATKNSVGKPTLLTDGNTANNGSGNADASYCSSGSADSFGGKKPADGTAKVSLTLADGSAAEYWYVAQVTLAKAEKVNGVGIYLHGYKTTVMDGGFDILVSADGKTWTRVASYEKQALFSGPADGKGYENYVASTTAAANAEDKPAYVITDFTAVDGVKYVAYGCTAPREINGYYTARFTEFEVYAG